MCPIVDGMLCNIGRGRKKGTAHRMPEVGLEKCGKENQGLVQGWRRLVGEGRGVIV
jgi:hypothetical protein